MLMNLTCALPMSVFTASPYNLAFDDLIKVRVSATNSFGEQSQSPENSSGAKVRKVPDAMAAVTMLARTLSNITVGWTALSTITIATGNSRVLAYQLRWDQGSGSTIYLLTESLVTNFTVTGLTGGASYQFKIRAKNIYGYGDYSTVTSIQASDVPQLMAIPTVIIDSTVLTSVRITWTAPSNSFSAITAYRLYFIAVDGSLVQDTTNCPGTNPAVLTCLSPMSTIRTLTSQSQGTLI